MGIEGIALEHHGDVPVFRLHVVHQLPVDVQLAAGDLLQAGNHPQRGGLAAAGGADKDDELLVLDIQIELLDSNDALGSHLEIDFLLGVSGLLLAFFLSAAVGIDFGDALQIQTCHNSRPWRRGLRRLRLAPVKGLYDRSPHCRTAGRRGLPPFLGAGRRGSGAADRPMVLIHAP